MTIWTIFSLSTHTIGEKSKIVKKIMSLTKNDETKVFSLTCKQLAFANFLMLMVEFFLKPWLQWQVCQRLLRSRMRSSVLSLSSLLLWGIQYQYSLVSACWSFVDILLSKVPMTNRQISSPSFIWRNFFWKILYWRFRKKSSFI